MRKMSSSQIYTFVVGLLVTTLAGTCSSLQLNFSNPISDLPIDRLNSENSILHLGLNYYVAVGSPSGILIMKSEILTNFRNATSRTIHPFGEPVLGTIFSSKMQVVDGDLYMYFVGVDANPGSFYQLYGMKAENGSDPMGNWSPPVAFLNNYSGSQFFIDVSLMSHGGKYYMVLCSFFQDTPGSMYITELLNPLQVTGEVLFIHSEVGLFPSFLYNGNVSYLITTDASRPGSDGRGLKQLSIPSERDPMRRTNWEFGEGLVFEENVDEGVLDPGYSSFTDSPDGTEIWMVYVASNGSQYSLGLERIDWNLDGSPKFPKAHGHAHPQPVPRGQTRT